MTDQTIHIAKASTSANYLSTLCGQWFRRSPSMPIVDGCGRATCEACLKRWFDND